MFGVWYISIRTMNGRLTNAIIGTILEELALAILVLWGLPRLGIKLPVYVVVLLMLAQGAIAVITYRIGSRILNKKPLTGLTSMLGTTGKVVQPLQPDGMVKIGGELWQARAEEGNIEAGEAIVTVGQEGFKLVVRRENTPSSQTSSADL